ncbi:hypothetical protein G6F56_004791 [Rhizopus delemar]|uniref:Myb-like domain-containing protein n=1 Tax=Rhizopus stolonifer TaxID=4846 RepID=A0A367KYC1_RHIST|nr:hypothetical protein G6F56_004791 [Rhizopus delemar]RCI07185.1 hypothetical protein CU098_013966 [Rhizopus stolonifer]
MNIEEDHMLYEEAIEGLLRLKTFDSQTSLNSSSSSSCSSDWRPEFRLPPVSQILMPQDTVDNYIPFCSLSPKPTRRRGRPRKPEYVESIKKGHSNHTFVNMGYHKPRWNDNERKDLLEAIVKEKNLDDMSTICWERISAEVGRATKACKDQWRRELLPNIRKKFQTRGQESKEIRNNEK